MPDIVLNMVPVQNLPDGVCVLVPGFWKEIDKSLIDDIEYLYAQEKAQKIMERTQDPVPDKRFLYLGDPPGDGYVPGLEAPTVGTLQPCTEESDDRVQRYQVVKRPGEISLGQELGNMPGNKSMRMAVDDRRLGLLCRVVTWWNGGAHLIKVQKIRKELYPENLQVVFLGQKGCFHGMSIVESQLNSTTAVAAQKEGFCDGVFQLMRAGVQNISMGIHAYIVSYCGWVLATVKFNGTQVKLFQFRDTL